MPQVQQAGRDSPFSWALLTSAPSHALHTNPPGKPRLSPTLIKGLAQHSRMGGEQMACSSPSHLFSLKTLSKENPGSHCSILAQ